MSLLDVGCGPGTITRDLARRVAPGRVVGADLSTDVIRQAGRAARAEGLDALGLVAGDFRDLRGGTFDVVHAHQVPSTCVTRWTRCGPCAGSHGRGASWPSATATIRRWCGRPP